MNVVVKAFWTEGCLRVILTLDKPAHDQPLSQGLVSFQRQSTQQRDCPLPGVTADIDLTLILPLGMARGCPGVSRGQRQEYSEPAFQVLLC